MKRLRNEQGDSLPMNQDEHDFDEQISGAAADTQALLSRLFEVAEPGAVFGPPVETDRATIITASEVMVAMGAGFGGGAGPVTGGDQDEDDAAQSGLGMGGGGGGFAQGRPVAALIVDEAGVRVQPILDTTKIGIALFSTLLALGISFIQLFKVVRENRDRIESLRA
jgi:uncharacterized spore protein YtfJ